MFYRTIHHRGNASVGNVHFAPNSTKDYDWTNKTITSSTWKDWRDNYPNLTGKKTQVSSSDWVPLDKENEAARYHHRWWFSLFPYYEGRANEGYLNNWWEYFVTMDCVEKIEATSEITLTQGQKIDLPTYTLKYISGKTKTVKYSSTNYSNIENKEIVDILDNKLYAKKEGTTKITTYYDGISNIINIKINKNTSIENSVSNTITEDKTSSNTKVVPDVKVSSNAKVDNDKNTGGNLNDNKNVKTEGNKNKNKDVKTEINKNENNLLKVTISVVILIFLIVIGIISLVKKRSGFNV